MEAKATVKYLRTTPRKAKLVVDEVRGLSVGEALNLLRFSIKKAVSRDVEKVIKSAVANFQDKHKDLQIDEENLKIKEIFVNDGPTLKRYRAKAQGRAGKILKHMCHITVTVSN